MTQTKIEGKFYPLKNDEWLTIAKKLTHSELLVLYHLRTLEPFGDKLTESSTKDVAEATGISQRSVQRSLIKLAELELIDLQIQKFAFKLRSQGATALTDSDSAVASTSPVSPTRQACRDDVSAVAKTSGVSQTQAETHTTPDFENSKTYSDFKDLLDSLRPELRGYFEKFCHKRIDECSFKIGSRKAWLAAHGLEYWEEFQVLYPKAAESDKNSDNSPQKEKPDINYLKKRYRDGWKEAAEHFGYSEEEINECL